MERGSRTYPGQPRDDKIVYHRRPIADISTRYRTHKPLIPESKQTPVQPTVAKKKDNPQDVDPAEIARHINHKAILTSRKILSSKDLQTPAARPLPIDGFIVSKNNHQKSIEPVSQRSAVLARTNKSQHRQLDFVERPVNSRIINKDPARSSIPKVPELPIPNHNKIQKAANKFKHTSTKRKRGYAMSAVAVLLLIFGVGVNIHSFMVTKEIKTQSTALAASDNNSSAGPSPNAGYSEEQPTTQAINQYQVAPDMPKYLGIPSLGVLSRVVRVSTDNKTGDIGTPINVFDTAWYEGSAKPGEKGAVFLDGHVSGSTKGGVFVGLKNIKVGAVITIVMGDNTELKYRVAEVEKFESDKVDMQKALKPYDPTKQGLNIMTCNGKFSKDTQTYDKRLVVYAVREN